MGIVARANTFTGQANPQLPWLDTELNTLFALVNGEIDDANIKALAGIAQSKIAALPTDLAAIRASIDALTAALAVFQAADSNAKGTRRTTTVVPTDADFADDDITYVY